MTCANLIKELKLAADPLKAEGMARFFKTGKGQYGEGDIFLGIPTQPLRKIALRYCGLSLDDLHTLLASKLHEHRTAALEILVVQYQRGDAKIKREIVRFYLDHTDRINNWDLVDLSCRAILGEHLKTHPRAVLRRLARSKSLWERRIAMVSTMTLAWEGEIDDAFQIAEILLDDKHDLIHKAIGWVLREIGILYRPRLLAFLETHYAHMPRTALRYAIEHLTPEDRKKILRGEFRT